MALLRAHDTTAVMSEINITPFTDVLLVLLIVFMVLAAIVAPPGFQKRLPCRCDGHPITAQPKPVDVTVDQGGQLFVGARRSDARRIYADLQAALRAGNTRAISLEAAGKAPYGVILRVLDAAKANGDADVTLVTE